MPNNLEIKNILKQFAFSTSEAAIYCAALSLGKAKVSEIAKKAHLNRTAAYASIRHLMARGVINQVKIERALHFTALPPLELSDKFQRIANDFKTVVPHLEALNRIEYETPAIEITESSTGYYKVYEQISNLPEGSTLRVIEGQASYSDEVSLLTEDQLNTFFSKMIERKIETKGIFTDETLQIPALELSPENLRLNRQRIWHLRSLPRQTLPLENLALIYGNRVSFLFPETALVLTIRHQGLADIMTSMFDALFVFAKNAEKVWN